MSRTLSGLFLVGALNRPRKRKGTNRENPQTISEQIGKIPAKSGKSQKGQKRKDKSRSGNPPVLNPPRLAALDNLALVFMRPRTINARHVAKWACVKPKGGEIAPFSASANLPDKVSSDMGYRSDSLAISRDMSDYRGNEQNM